MHLLVSLMSEIVKSIEDLENIFRKAVLKILKINEDTQGRVRFPWGSSFSNDNGSVPIWKRNEDVCMIYALPQDGSYNRQRDISYIPSNEDGFVIRVDEHTDIHYVVFSNYGNNAYECARAIRDGFYKEEIKEYLQLNNIYLVPDVPAIKRVPELINGQWWNRADFSAVFNEYVRLEEKMKTIEHTNVTSIAVTGNGRITNTKSYY